MLLRTVRFFRRSKSNFRKIVLRLRGCQIEKRVYIGPRVKISGPKKITIQKGVILTRDITLSAFKEIIIEKDVQLAPYSAIYDSNHEMPITSGKRKISSVKIGQGSWLGHGATILKGVKIGKNVTVAAGSVVTKSFPKNSIVGGIPAKKIGENKS